jgi:Mg2+ and Co2+ transporter CorA
MRQLLKKINRAALECSVTITEDNALKNITDDDVDGLAEAIELLNDIYEELYNKVFEEPEEE